MNDQFFTETSGEMFCQDCGEPLSPDATFCPNCGSRKMSKPSIDDTELPFQYVTPSIETQSYSAMAPDFDLSDLTMSGGYDAEDDTMLAYDPEPYGADDYGGNDIDRDYSDFEETMYPERIVAKRPAPKKRPAAQKKPAQGTRRPASARKPRKGASGSADSRNASIRVLIAAAFLSLVLIVSLIGFLVSLFSGNDGIQTVESESAGTSSVASSVSSSVSSSAASDKKTPSKPVVHLLPEDVRNSSYTRYTLDQNTFTTAMASSFINAKLTHGTTELAFDGDPETSWQDGVKGYGIGEWLLAYNSDGSAVKVSEVTVYNGYQNPKFNTAKKDMYLVNSRVSDFTLTFDDGTSESFTLEDKKDPQTFQFKERETCYVRFTIGGVYKGTKYKDTCVGELIYK